MALKHLNHEIQSPREIQDDKDTEGRLPQQEAAGRPPDSLIRKLRESIRSQAKAKDLADVALWRDNPEQGVVYWLAFKLARRVHGWIAEGGFDPMECGPDPFLKAAQDFAGLYGLSKEDQQEFVVAFEARWFDVKIPENQDPLFLALQRVKAASQVNIARLPFKAIKDVRLVAALAYEMQQLQGPDPILLPVKRVAYILGKSAQHASNCIRILERKGILRCVNPSYSYREKQAKEWFFVEPEEPIYRPRALSSCELNQDIQDTQETEEYDDIPANGRKYQRG